MHRRSKQMLQFSSRRLLDWTCRAISNVPRKKNATFFQAFHLTDAVISLHISDQQKAFSGRSAPIITAEAKAANASKKASTWCKESIDLSQVLAAKSE